MPEDSARSVIVIVRPLSEGANARYVESGRRIPAEISAKYLVEVRYRLADGREFSAAGFENRSGGYELRSASFKGSVGRKDFSVIGKLEA